MPKYGTNLNVSAIANTGYWRVPGNHIWEFSSIVNGAQCAPYILGIAHV